MSALAFVARYIVKRCMGAASCPRQASEAPNCAALPGLKALLSDSTEDEVKCCRKILTIEVSSLVQACEKACKELILEEEESSDAVAVVAGMESEEVASCKPAEERADCEAAFSGTSNEEHAATSLDLVLGNYNIDTDLQTVSGAGQQGKTAEDVAPEILSGEDGSQAEETSMQPEFESRDQEGDVVMSGEEKHCKEGANGARESEEEWYKAQETTSLARSSSLSSFFDIQPEHGPEEMGTVAGELPVLRRSFSTDDALTLLATSNKPATGGRQTRRRHQNGGRPARRERRLLAQLPRDEQRLLLVLHLMLLLPPEEEVNPQKCQQAGSNGTANGGCSPKQLRQPAKGGWHHEARGRNQHKGTLGKGCKNY